MRIHYVKTMHCTPYFDIDNAKIYVDLTPAAPGKPTLVLIHGVLCDHSVWQPITATLTRQGLGCAALDLPGHGRSSGKAPRSVQEAAAYIGPLLDALALPQACLVGHSWGSLIALHAAAHLGARVPQLALIGTASPMRVAPALLALAATEPLQALALVDQYSRSSHTPAGINGTALGQQLLAQAPTLLHTGLQACATYQDAPTAMQRTTAATLFLQGEEDRMTPAKASLELLATAQQRPGSATELVTLACGHMHMVDAPEAVSAALLRLVGEG